MLPMRFFLIHSFRWYKNRTDQISHPPDARYYDSEDANDNRVDVQVFAKATANARENPVAARTIQPFLIHNVFLQMCYLYQYTLCRKRYSRLYCFFNLTLTLHALLMKENPGSGSCSYRCPDFLRLYAFGFGGFRVTGFTPPQLPRFPA